MNNTVASRPWYPWFVAFIGLAVLFISNGYTATALSVFDEALLTAGTVGLSSSATY